MSETCLNNFPWEVGMLSGPIAERASKTVHRASIVAKPAQMRDITDWLSARLP